MASFKLDLIKGNNPKMREAFDKVYRLLFPKLDDIVVFDDYENNSLHADMQKEGKDVGLLVGPNDFYVDEKIGDDLLSRPGFPVEIKHVYSDGDTKPGWVLDKNHNPNYFAHGCLKTGFIAVLDANQVKKSYMQRKDTFDKKRISQKENEGGYTTTAIYVDYMLLDKNVRYFVPVDDDYVECDSISECNRRLGLV